MRAITVRQPWAWAIIHGGKDVENRSRNIAGGYRGPVAIHAGLAKFEQHNMASRALRAAHGTEVDARVLYGAIIGVVDLDSVLPPHPVCDYCSPWAQDGAHQLVLANPRPLAQPIPARGRLGLWRPDADLLAAITEQVTP